MQAPTQAQLYSGLRYAGTAVATTASLFVFLGALDSSTSDAAIAAFREMLAGLQQTIGAAYKLVYILGPVIAFWLGKAGVSAQGIKQQIANVQEHPKAQVLVSDPKLAEGIPGVKIVAPSKISPAGHEA
jgi:hypothetical protein